MASHLSGVVTHVSPVSRPVCYAMPCYDKVANTQPSAASMSTDLYGMATLDACRQIIARLQPIKATMPDASLAEVANIA